MTKIIDRNYGSIPHLSISKMSQQADKKICEGQENILTKRTRDWKDLIIVTEKLDGSNVGIYNDDGEMQILTRAGYHAETSKFEMHHHFIHWYQENHRLFNWLPNKWRVVGEWCAMAHGTKYNITGFSPFVAFDIFNEKNKRLVFLDFFKYCSQYEIPIAPIVHIGAPIKIDKAMQIIGKGIYGNPEKPEGIVYRCERDNRVDFLAKYVRADKEDGKYLNQDIWNVGYLPPRMAGKSLANGV